MVQRKRYRLCEQEFFIPEGSPMRDGAVVIPQDTFEQLEDFVYEKKMPDPTGRNSYMMQLEEDDKGKLLRASEYVGAIVFKDGTQIELLPMSNAVDANGNQLSNKRVMLNMLRTVKKLPLSNSAINTRAAEGLNIFETFILAFINEVQLIIHNSLKKEYQPYTENERFLKGKVIYSLHATKNFAHKDKFYVQYDVFSINRAENRLIKSTLKYLQGVTSSARSRNKIDALIANFDGVDYSMSYRQDFAACVIDRSMVGYGNAITWAEIFLLGKGVNVTTGRNVSYAVVFTMSELFDCFTASSLGRMLDNQRFHAELQKKRYPMLNRAMPRDSAQALVVITMRENGMRVVFDSKWQKLSQDASNYGIYQSDINNLYELLEMHKADSVCYIYPSFTRGNDRTQEICFRNEDGILGRVCFADIGDMEKSLSQIVEHIFGMTVSSVSKLK